MQGVRGCAPADALLEGLDAAGAGERQPAEEAFVEHDAHAPHVRRAAVVREAGVAGEQLRRGEGRGAAVLEELRAGRDDGGEAKVSDLAVARAVEQDVFWLQVAVADVAAVAEHERRNALPEDALRLRLTEVAFRLHAPRV